MIPLPHQYVDINTSTQLDLILGLSPLSWPIQLLRWRLNSSNRVADAFFIFPP